MAYTIINVAEMTGISPHTLRFWAKKGLLPFVERDKNGVKYFSKSDVEWIKWINWFRRTNMSLQDIKKYVELALRGDSTAKERMQMLQRQQKMLLTEISTLQEVAAKLDYKLNIYSQLTANDAMNPNSKDYVKCENICEKPKTNIIKTKAKHKALA